MNAPADLAGWGLHCFCPTARRTPHSIVQLDNNGEILAAAVRPVRPEDLAASGIAVTDSQIRVLCDNGVLEADNDMIRTAVPVLGPDVIGPIRERLEDVSHGVIDLLVEPVGVVRDALTAAGHRDSVWAVTFGHALDGLLWRELDARGELPPTQLDVDHPDWRGCSGRCSRSGPSQRDQLPAGRELDPGDPVDRRGHRPGTRVGR